MGGSGYARHLMRTMHGLLAPGRFSATDMDDVAPVIDAQAVQIALPPALGCMLLLVWRGVVAALRRLG